MSSLIGSDGETKTWDRQNLIRYDALVDILQQILRVEPHPTPENTYGSLVCVGGVAQAAREIMDYLEERAIEENRKNGVHNRQGPPIQNEHNQGQNGSRV